MPELPEVETTRRGIAPHLLHKTVIGVTIRQPRLRWPIPAQLNELLSGQRVQAVERRAKYLLLRFDHGSLIIHLGMSGSLRMIPQQTRADKHDHFDLLLMDGQLLRLRDPRRFGAVLWTSDDPALHPLISPLGPEPLANEFSSERLYRIGHKRRSAVKNLIMDSHVVVGVGNIYANESLFLAGIHPQRISNRISASRYERLVNSIKQVLTEAIRQGGTTLKDFQQADGNPGYFTQQLLVYGHGGEPCPNCGASIVQRKIGQRSSFFCPVCQR